MNWHSPHPGTPSPAAGGRGVGEGGIEDARRAAHPIPPHTRVAIATALLLLATPAPAQDRQETWQREKCAAYAAAWTEAQRRFGTAGLGRDFTEGHAVFLASGCRAGRDICPRSPEELAMADHLTVAAMNSGTASTFPPFRCRGG